MQVIIPMSGFGERFRRAGFKVPKPLIEVNGKPIISHVIDLFDQSCDFIFVCNEDHLKTTQMETVLNKYCPNGKIRKIKSHKLGPVHAVKQAYDLISDKEPLIINYCDFTCYWNFEHFKHWIKKVNPDGCIPAYKGFHPHSAGTTNYAYMEEKGMWMSKIQEKKPFTSDKSKEYASSGTYYFKSGEMAKYYIENQINNALSTNGEYYCSLAFNPMVEDSLKVAIYEIQHFMQWGTPQDLAEYKRWSNIFEYLASKSLSDETFDSVNLIAMAGNGSRFKRDGYRTPKPFLHVSGYPMALQAAKLLPKTKKLKYIALQEHMGWITDNKETWDGDFITLREVSDGQATTCLEATREIDKSLPLVISSCDHGSLINIKKYQDIFNTKSWDVIVWVTKGHPGAIKNPEMYGWVESTNNIIKKVEVKKPLSNPHEDHIIIGTFTFRTTRIFEECAEELTRRDGRVNGELYVDSCINDAIRIGYRCKIFEVDHYLCWGTPTDLKTFAYWQECFHKWDSHPYRIENDMMMDANSRAALKESITETNSIYPFHDI